MLSVVDRNGRPVRPLDAAEAETMLAAFARPGATALARTRGADIVRKVQQRDWWFRCGCLDGTEPAPILVPVLEQHIRRSPHHPDHADGCPFEMGDAGNAAHARRLREPEPGEVFRLVRAVRPGDGAAAAAGARTGLRGAYKTYDRDKLSQLLFKLLSDAEVHRVGRGPRGPGEQWEAVYRAARGIPLGEGLSLSEVLHTDPGQLGLLLGCLRSRQHWPKMTRPHGVLVFVAARIEPEVLVVASGARLAVKGPSGKRCAFPRARRGRAGRVARWLAERSNAWLLENKRLASRYDRLSVIVQALLQTACILLVGGRLVQVF